MRTEHKAGEADVFPWGADCEPARPNKLAGRDMLQTHLSGADSSTDEAPEPSEQPGRWQSIIGKIVAFSPEPNNHGVRYCGAVLNVSEAPDYAGLPTCLATVRGRSGKTIVIDFTKCYAQIHQTWKEAEQ